MNLFKLTAQRLLPVPVQNLLRGRLPTWKRWRTACWLRLGKTEPLRRDFGAEDGQPIDRYYIEQFLSQYATDIHGHVLEVGDNDYTRRFGSDRVTHSDVLHVSPDHLKATIIGDLTSADHIPSETFDCIILTQTLQYPYHILKAIRTCYRILKSGGVILVTLPGIQQIDREDMEAYGEYWRFTTLSAHRLFTEYFPDDCVTVQSYGNVLAAMAFLYGVVTEELKPHQLDLQDRDYEMTITVRAVKPFEK
ncbi:MAG: hypothetical protein NPIRA02_01760 [Nitrospirales bacterium]|nr:MAG: hypothetical protein NPIRA02_01760 [Nitrospirales bacterium]